MVPRASIDSETNLSLGKSNWDFFNETHQNSMGSKFFVFAKIEAMDDQGYPILASIKINGSTNAEQTTLTQGTHFLHCVHEEKANDTTEISLHLDHTTHNFIGGSIQRLPKIWWLVLQSQ